MDNFDFAICFFLLALVGSLILMLHGGINTIIIKDDCFDNHNNKIVGLVCEKEILCSYSRFSFWIPYCEDYDEVKE
jgi:hypothetical protein